MRNNTTKKSFQFFCLPLALMILVQVVKAQQPQNGLDFDNVDDAVTAPNASALLAGGSGISIAFWVHPDNPSCAFPDYDGYCGFRNNTDADFYLVQIYSNNVIECRFRNSSGVVFDILHNGVQIGAWQHYAMTHTGSELTVYYNGAYYNSVAASGTITNPNEPFFLGNMPFQTYFYQLLGKLDDVGLWNRAISGAEVACIYNSGINPSSPGLQLCYKMNQGISGGTNTGITALTDSAAHINGVLNNFALTGNTSNFVDGVDLNYHISGTVCPGGTYIFGTHSLTAAGTYQETFSDTSGCDSTVVLLLTFAPVDTSVMMNGETLIANAGGSTYQWIDCGTGNPIAGETNQTYTATANGSYAVIVSQANCSDTSSCYTVTSVGIQENSFANDIRVFPNPVEDQLIIHCTPLMRTGLVELKVFSAIGETVYENTFHNPRLVSIDVSKWAAGAYVLEAVSGTGRTLLQVMKR